MKQLFFVLSALLITTISFAQTKSESTGSYVGRLIFLGVIAGVAVYIGSSLFGKKQTKKK